MDAKEAAREVIETIATTRGKIDIQDAEGLALYNQLGMMQTSLEYLAKEKPSPVKAPDVI